MSIQEQILDVLKKQMLPEIAEIKAEQQEARMREVRMSARLDVIDGRLERMDERFEQIDKRFDEVDKRFEQVDKRFEQVDKRFERVDRAIRELHEDLREVRSYVFVSRIGPPRPEPSVVRDPASPPPS
jgi:chromosome segregation ATPase